MKILFLLILSCVLSAAETHVYPVEKYRVIDGDTVEVTLNLGFNLTITSNVRLYGINTPEVRGEEKEEGLAVKAYVIEYLKDKTLTCKYLKQGKYGNRFIGKLFVNDIDLSNHLLTNKMAEVYEEK